MVASEIMAEKINVLSALLIIEIVSLSYVMSYIQRNNSTMKKITDSENNPKSTSFSRNCFTFSGITISQEELNAIKFEITGRIVQIGFLFNLFFLSLCATTFDLIYMSAGYTTDSLTEFSFVAFCGFIMIIMGIVSLAISASIEGFYRKHEISSERKLELKSKLETPVAT